MICDALIFKYLDDLLGLSERNALLSYGLLLSSKIAELMRMPQIIIAPAINSVWPNSCSNRCAIAKPSTKHAVASSVAKILMPFIRKHPRSMTLTKRPDGLV